MIYQFTALRRIRRSPRGEIRNFEVKGSRPGSILTEIAGQLWIPETIRRYCRYAFSTHCQKELALGCRGRVGAFGRGRLSRVIEVGWPDPHGQITGSERPFGASCLRFRRHRTRG